MRGIIDTLSARRVGCARTLLAGDRDGHVALLIFAKRPDETTAVSVR
jgi:hypothetical protein